MILKELQSKSNFTSTERNLADYILSHAQEVVHMNQNVLADAAFVSPACISRFCRKLECKNYRDFKLCLIKELQDVNGKVIDMNYPFQPGDTLEDIARSLYSANVSGLKSCMETLDPAVIASIARDIILKGCIDVYGVGVTVSAAVQFREYMSRIGYPTHIYDNIYEQELRVLTNDATHMAIIISYSGKTRSIVEAARILYQRGSWILLITANRFSEMAKYAKYVLTINSGEQLSISGKLGMFSSLTSVSYLLNVIYAYVFVEDYDKHKKYLEQTAKYQLGFFEGRSDLSY